MFFFLPSSLIAFLSVFASTFGVAPIDALAISPLSLARRQDSSLGDASSVLSTLDRRTVWNPRIEHPNAQTTWKSGTRVTVTWDTSSMPQNVSNSHGKVLLGYMTDSSESENLNTTHPLADGFLLTAGKVEVQVPQVPSRKDYIVVLLGDSGNHSPRFTIA
ncbi:hypothetical protein HGRIS_006338 [Hohenbuehelia grisea]|uniref:Yeast cell wall synthesis Kre9/Knh1-like N-terminal domain-containing protein n=1 Tax=Hohenbuehelia grisea TaxID=104357 RepID=A0ABR3K0H4_9AGAR